MLKKITFFLLLIVVVYSGNISAQQNFTLYNNQRIPQSMYANPALMPYSKVNIGLPVISSVYFNFSNNGFKAKDVLIKGSDDSLRISPGNLISKLKKDNYMSMAFQTDLLSFGFRVAGKHYFSFNSTEKILFRFRYPKDFMQFIWEGNAGENVIGKELKFNFGVDAIHYREYGIGYALKLFDKLSLGTRLKYLYGMENIYTEKSDIGFYTDPTTFDLTAKGNILIRTSGIDSNGTARKKDDPKGYALGLNNKGWGLDLGGDYKLFDFFALNASITDIGAINWKSDVTNYKNANPDAEFTYRGISLDQFLRDSTKIEDAFNEVLDSMSGIFKINESHESYKTKFSPQIYLAGNFIISKKSKAGLIYYSQFYDKKYHPGVSLNFTMVLGRALTYCASYSIYNRSYNNFGFGFSSNAGPIQLYMISDNVLGPIFPASAKNINLRFGLNLTFGWDSKAKNAKEPEPAKPVKPRKIVISDIDHDSIPDVEDACPDIFGLRAFNGCPDKDGDSIPDKDDKCPDVKGLAAFQGCPDTDGDGIEDKNDSCVTVPGLAQFHGCPDTDGDGIEDKLDSCVNAPGLAVFNGCPDKDGDGIPDKLDDCPDKAGIAKFKGCPDKDGDGIPDADDECPDRPGLVMYLGCPDSDLDGVPDQLDDCPDTYGSKDNKGCPLVKVQEKFQAAVIEQKEQEILKTAFDNLTFNSGKSTMNPVSLTSLDILADMMKLKPDYKLYVSGHTDNVGNAASNKKLSENRAKAVKTYLASKGVNAAKITTEGFGSTRPVADNKSVDGKAKNRRVELKIIK